LSWLCTGCAHIVHLQEVHQYPLYQTIRDQLGLRNSVGSATLVMQPTGVASTRSTLAATSSTGPTTGAVAALSGSLAQGQIVQQSFLLDPATSAQVQVYQGSNGQISTALRDPTGAILTPTASLHYDLSSPVPGTWTLELTGTSLPAAVNYS